MDINYDSDGDLDMGFTLSGGGNSGSKKESH